MKQSLSEMLVLKIVNFASGVHWSADAVRQYCERSYFEATRGYLERYGKPVAFYSDKASIFRPRIRRPATGA